MSGGKTREVRSTGPRLMMRALSIIGLFVLNVPLLILVVQSFQSPGAPGFTWEWHLKAWQNPIIWAALKNSLLIAVLSTLISTFLG
ncbi:MAG: hypothetical protein AAB425_10655, partial [Bdellovibrionota bacterium]